MKCHACGRELNKDVKHCMYCGTPVPSGKEQASLKPIVNLKEQGLLQPDSRRPFPRWIPAALSGVLLLCLTLYWIIPKANSSDRSNTDPEPSAEAAALTEANQTLLLMPQTLSDAAALSITYSIVTTTPARTITETVSVPLKSLLAKWDRNNQIVYTLNIGLHPIEISASAEDWGEDEYIVIVE